MWLIVIARPPLLLERCRGKKRRDPNSKGEKEADTTWANPRRRTFRPQRRVLGLPTRPLEGRVAGDIDRLRLEAEYWPSKHISFGGGGWRRQWLEDDDEDEVQVTSRSSFNRGLVTATMPSSGKGRGRWRAQVKPTTTDQGKETPENAMDCEEESFRRKTSLDPIMCN